MPFDDRRMLRKINICNAKVDEGMKSFLVFLDHLVKRNIWIGAKKRKPTYFCFMIYRWLEKKDEKEKNLNTLGLISIPLLWQRVKQQLCETYIGFCPAAGFPVSLRLRCCCLRKHVPLQGTVSMLCIETYTLITIFFTLFIRIWINNSIYWLTHTPRRLNILISSLLNMQFIKVHTFGGDLAEI